MAICVPLDTIGLGDCKETMPEILFGRLVRYQHTVSCSFFVTEAHRSLASQGVGNQRKQKRVKE